jgi:hypothetical protein
VIFTQTDEIALSRNMMGKMNIYQLLMPIFTDLLPISVCILETLVVDLKLQANITAELADSQSLAQS